MRARTFAHLSAIMCKGGKQKDSSTTTSTPTTAAATTPKPDDSKALSGDEVVSKLNEVPCFCLLNGEKNIVGLQDPMDPTGTLEICCWFTDPNEAQSTLAQCKEANPAISSSLHLGVTPLGLAFAFSSGWVESESQFYGEKQVRGSSVGFAEGQDATALLREQAKAQGLDPRSWHVPLFSCEELQSPQVAPLFLSRKALAEAWVVSGRKLTELPQNLTVLDLGVVVHQMMQPGIFDWKTVHFVSERKAVQLVQESHASANGARATQPVASTVAAATEAD